MVLSKKLFVFVIIAILLYPVISKAEDTYSKIVHKENILIDCNGIVVDDHENIYLGNGLFRSIQVYDQNGIYTHSIKVDTMGSFTMSIENEYLYVALARGQKVITYDKEGYIVEENEVKHSEIFKRFRRECIGNCVNLHCQIK